MPLHVYGVVRAGTPLPGGLQGLFETPVTTVTDAGLAALVSEHPEGPQARRAELMCHVRILEQVVEDQTVLPLEFGKRMPDEQAVRDHLLGPHRARLESLMTEFDDSVQLTVKVAYREDDALREVLRRSPQLDPTGDRLATLPADAAHLERADLGPAVAADLERMGQRDGAEIMAALAPLALAHAESRHVSAYHVLNTAFLVRRESRPHFDEAVGAIAQQWNELATVRYLGPQPPYSFVDLELGDPA